MPILRWTSRASTSLFFDFGKLRFLGMCSVVRLGGQTWRARGVMARLSLSSRLVIDLGNLAIPTSEKKVDFLMQRLSSLGGRSAASSSSKDDNLLHSRTRSVAGRWQSAVLGSLTSKPMRLSFVRLLGRLMRLGAHGPILNSKLPPSLPYTMTSTSSSRGGRCSKEVRRRG